MLNPSNIRWEANPLGVFFAQRIFIWLSNQYKPKSRQFVN